MTGMGEINKDEKVGRGERSKKGWRGEVEWGSRGEVEGRR